MDYDRIYGDLIWRGIERSEGWRNKKKREGYERHHIVPKCMGGGDEPENLVLLTIREHFVAHRLLTKIYPGNLGLFQAVFFMSRTREGVRIVSSRGFSDLRGVIEGTAVYTNGEGRTMRFLTGSVPEGYFGVCAGTAVYSDGRGVRRFRAGYQPEGWCHISKGTALYKDEEGNIKRFPINGVPKGYCSAAKGEATYRNDEGRVRRFPVGEQPEGWYGWRKGIGVYSNGLENRCFPVGEQPEGWESLKASKETRVKLSESKSGVRNHNYDHNLYSFRNTLTGVTEEGITQHSMREKYKLNGGNLGSLIKGRVGSCEGWVILLPDGWDFYTDGTNIKRFQDGLSPLGWWKTSEKTVKYCKGGETKRFPEGRQPEGWSRVVLSEDSKNRSAAFFRGENNPRRDNNLYSFRNTRDGSLELGVTRKHMVEKYGLGQGKLGSLVSGKKKKYKGWVIFPEPSHAGG